MFMLFTLEDRVRVHPRDFRKKVPQAVTDEINKKYANKIKHKVGLCIRVWDILEVGEGVVHACQDGSYMSKVKFRMIVFRPFMSEVLVGKVGTATAQGMRSEYKGEGVCDPEKSQWVWRYLDDDSPPDAPEYTDMPLEKDEPVRFRVEAEEFRDVGPIGVGIKEAQGVTLEVGDAAYSIT
ncbi:DNA-directed RNA polymerase III subunit rpc25, partial [Irineochytrium annulatum]